MTFTPEELAQIRAQAEAQYPAECCGVLLVRGGAPADRMLLPCRNIQDELHAKDPERHPRDSRTAYFIDPKDLLAHSKNPTVHRFLTRGEGERL